MFDDYINSQKIAYKTLSNALHKDKIAHAYIIETNGNVEGLNFAKAFAKILLCPKKYTNLENCNGCNQCQTIDDNNYLELKIIEPDGVWFKKNQIDELQELFSKKAIIGNKKIYIINKADKMKEALANSLLKFIEEPQEGIIAILVTDNTNKILKTITSRCQIISLVNNNQQLNGLDTISKISKYINNSVEEENTFFTQEIIEQIIKFIEYYEKNHINTIIHLKPLWHDYFNDRKNVEVAFLIILLYYKDVLNMLMNKDLVIFNDYIDSVSKVAKLNDINKITNKIEIVINLQKRIQYNVNLNLLMDKLVIDLEKSE